MASGGYRPNSGPAKGTKYRPRGSKKEPKAKIPKIPQDIKDAAKAENLDPLAYMLKVMNDPNEDKDMRARMAVAAAPYVHPRKGDGAGKKQDRDDKAKQAGAGKFAPSAPPSLKVVK